MKLQIALDDVTLEGALELVKKVRDYIDIIEIGTPFVYEYGMQAVRTMKEHFPDKEILADMKIMDAGYYEAEEALKAGADYVTVLGVTDNLTIQGCKEAAEKYGYEPVNVVPQLKAGGSFSTAAYHTLEHPVAVEHIKAHAGIDIGDTLIGMHMRDVAVPVRIQTKAIGGAHVVCARTRLKFVGGIRARYDEEQM